MTTERFFRSGTYLRADEFAEVDRIARERGLRWGRALRLLIRTHPETKLDSSILISDQ